MSIASTRKIVDQEYWLFLLRVDLLLLFSNFIDISFCMAEKFRWLWLVDAFCWALLLFVVLLLMNTVPLASTLCTTVHWVIVS